MDAYGDHEREVTNEKLLKPSRVDQRCDGGGSLRMRSETREHA